MLAVLRATRTRAFSFARGTVLSLRSSQRAPCRCRRYWQEIPPKIQAVSHVKQASLSSKARNHVSLDAAKSGTEAGDEDRYESVISASWTDFSTGISHPGKCQDFFEGGYLCVNFAHGFQPRLR